MLTVVNLTLILETYEGDPKNPKFIYKKLYIYSYMFKLQSSLKFSPFNAVYLLRLFFHYSKWFWTHQFWWLLVILPFFVSPLLHWQNVSLWGLFSSGKKKSCSEWDQMNKKGGAPGPAVLGQKLLNTQHSVGRYAHKSPIMKWANALSLKKFY